VSRVSEALGLHLDRESLAIARGDTVSVAPVWIATERQAAGPMVLGAQRILDALRERLAPAIAADARAVFAIPADFDAAAVARLARVCSMVGLADVAYVDAAALTAAVMRAPEAACVLQLGWRDFIVSRVAVDKQYARQATWLHASTSLTRLHDRWIECVAAAMVRRTRFDPLHDRDGEQALFAQLPAALDALQHSDVVRFAVQSASTTFTVELGARQFEEAAATIYTTIIDALLAAQSAERPSPCIVPQAVIRWPGFLARLRVAAPAEVRILPAELIARAAADLVGKLAVGRAYWRIESLASPRYGGTPDYSIDGAS